MVPCLFEYNHIYPLYNVLVDMTDCRLVRFHRIIIMFSNFFKIKGHINPYSECYALFNNILRLKIENCLDGSLSS